MGYAPPAATRFPLWSRPHKLDKDGVPSGSATLPASLPAPAIAPPRRQLLPGSRRRSSRQWPELRRSYPVPDRGFHPHIEKRQQRKVNDDRRPLDSGRAGPTAVDAAKSRRSARKGKKANGMTRTPRRPKAEAPAAWRRNCAARIGQATAPALHAKFCMASAEPMRFG